MLKQIFNKLPRKSLKSDPDESTRGDSSRSSDSPRASGKSHKLNGGGGVSAKRASSSAVFPASMVSGIEPLVPFKDVPNSEKLNLFVSKLSLCCVTFDFTDPGKNTMDKDVKRRTLVELVDFVNCGSMKFSEPAILAICRMCAINLFRVFPPHYRANGVVVSENDDDDPMFDPSWPHLQLVYELLLKFISSPCLDAKVAKKYIDHLFIFKLLELFDSEDPRERDCLKTILHRIYGKFMVHRPFIRKSMNNIFYRFVIETEKHNGIAELLEIFGSVISGFALPLKEEHKMFLWRVLIPLHKPKSVGVYFQQLSYCVTQFIEKEPKLASIVISGLLKYWPVTNSQKEVMFLGELEEILETINMVEFQRIMVPLFLRIGCCITSLHFQVSERALFLWNNDNILNLIAHNRQVILPILYPALDRNIKTHWNPAVVSLTLNIRKMFKEMDEKLFVSCHTHFKEEESMLISEAEKRNEAWKQLEHAASRKPVIGTEWFTYPGVWTTYILILFFTWIMVLSVFGCSPGIAWTIVNLAHFVVTYHFFHWKKGTPFADDQGIYNRLTWWEQVDNGKQLTRNRKFLTVVPLVLYLIASHTTDYENPMLFYNTVAVIVLVVAKFPNMHKVRIFGINADK